MAQLTYAGKPCCECQTRWLPAFEREAQALDIIDVALPLSQIIGGAKASGGTHSTGGADDTFPLTAVKDVAAYVRLSRSMGADATWLRPVNWDGAGGVAHVHRVLRGCPHNAPARYQIDAVDAGFNGLGSGGRGARDDGPRPLSGRTWEQGLAWQAEQAQARKKAALTDEIQALVKERDKLTAKIKRKRTTRAKL